MREKGSVSSAEFVCPYVFLASEMFDLKLHAVQMSLPSGSAVLNSLFSPDSALVSDAPIPMRCVSAKASAALKQCILGALCRERGCSCAEALAQPCE